MLAVFETSSLSTRDVIIHGISDDLITCFQNMTIYNDGFNAKGIDIYFRMQSAYKYPCQLKPVLKS